jgi:restriction system protein
MPPTAHDLLVTTDNISLYFTLFKTLWPYLLLGILVKSVPFIGSILRERRLAKSGIFEIDKMDGKSFEEYLGTLFTRQGYSVQQTPYQGDWGADLILSKGNVKTVVQAKRYKKSVGVRAVQEAVTAKAKYGCSEAMVVTNSTFTAQARELARANKVLLWDREKLVETMTSLNKERASNPH